MPIQINMTFSLFGWIFFSIFDDDNNFGRLSLLNADEINENNKICWVPKEHDSDKLFSMKLFIASHCKINNFIPN